VSEVRLVLLVPSRVPRTLHYSGEPPSSPFFLFACWLLTSPTATFCLTLEIVLYESITKMGSVALYFKYFFSLDDIWHRAPLSPNFSAQFAF